MKKKLATLLRRWAYSIHPETPATLPPGYHVAKVVSSDTYAPIDGKMPDAKTAAVIMGYLKTNVLEQIIDCNYIRARADISPVPGGLVEYEASLYVGFIPNKKKQP